jgi:uncharacterized protein YutD
MNQIKNKRYLTKNKIEKLKDRYGCKYFILKHGL